MTRPLMILAAGRGKRMRELTDERPKPLVPVLGRTLLDRVLDHAVQAGLSDIVINTCYKGELIENAVAARTDVSVRWSREKEALETGGGVMNALPLLLPAGKDGFFVANADPLWVDKTTSVFAQLAAAWNPETTDVLLALIPKSQAFGAVYGGDYFMTENGVRRRTKAETEAPFLFTGIQLLHPRIFDGEAAGVFSLVRCYDKAQDRGRLKAIIYDGDWYHVGTPEALAQTEQRLLK